MSSRRVALFAATALAVVAADQASKALVRATFDLGESHPVIEGVLWLTHVKNTGAAFGMLRGHLWLLMLIGVAVLGLIGYVMVRACPESPLARTALAMVAGGAAGNLIDRSLAGGVTDFFDLGWWPVFNVADICLDVGVALLVWWLLFGAEHRHAAPHGESAEAGECAKNVEPDADE